MYLTRDAGIETFRRIRYCTYSSMYLTRTAGIETVSVSHDISALHGGCILPVPYLRESNKNTPAGIFSRQGYFFFIRFYACLMESEIFSFPPSCLMSSTLTRTVWPICSSSSTDWTKWFAISRMCTSPLRRLPKSTNAP